MPTASRSSSENMTLVGSATATSTEPSSRKRIGTARYRRARFSGSSNAASISIDGEVELDELELVLLGEDA